MISPITFAGSYKTDNKNQETFKKFEKYAFNKEFKPGVSITYKMRKAEDFESFDYRNQKEIILTVPDEMDSDVEKYCARHGIEFTKLDND